MKKIVPETLLKNYILDNCSQTEDYLVLRKEISYNFAIASFLNLFTNHVSSLSVILFSNKN